MSEQFKFSIGRILVAPLMPIIFWQGKRIKNTFPSLPEAKGLESENGFSFQESIHIVGLGESTMSGVGIDQHANGLIGQFSNHLSQLIKKKVQWRVYAKSGLTAEQSRIQLLPKIEEDKVDLFVIALGGNDTFQLNSPKEWGNQVQLLIDELRERYPKAPILFTTMPPVHSFPAFTKLMQFVLGQLVRMHGRQLNKIIKSYDKVYFDAKTIDINQWLENRPDIKKEGLFTDGVHASSLTHTIWSKELAELIYQHYFYKA